MLIISDLAVTRIRLRSGTQRLKPLHWVIDIDVQIKSLKPILCYAPCHLKRHHHFKL